MATRGPVHLNDSQVELLRWIDQGCSPGVYEGVAHRVSARALERRGLTNIKGSGSAWTVSLTEAGRQRVVADKSSKTIATPRAKPAEGSVVRDMMSELARSARVTFTAEQAHSYRTRVARARKLNLVPDGKLLRLRLSGPEGGDVTLIDPPKWQAASYRVGSKQLAQLPEALAQLHSARVLSVPTRLQSRAVLLLDALRAESEQRGHRCKFKGPWGMRRDGEPRPIHISVGITTFQLSIYAPIERRPHEPSKSELRNRERWGSRIPVWDHEPSNKRLGLGLDEFGRVVAWEDTEYEDLEDSISSIVKHLEESNAAAERRQAEAEEARRVLEEGWRERLANAARRHEVEFFRSAVGSQVDDWLRAKQVREYATQYASSADLTAPQRQWVDQLLAHADDIDPIRRRPVPDSAPPPTKEDLHPYMNGWSVYGPYREWR